MGLKYDVVVVGAGPAGSSAAKAAAEQGVSVLILEKKDSVGVPVRCAEWVPQMLSLHVQIGRKHIARKIELLETHLPDGDVVRMRSPGWMLDRAGFDQSLALAAVRAGAHILTGSEVTDLHPQGVAAKLRGRREDVRAKVTIGADGPLSVTGRCIDQKNTDFVSAVQFEVPLERETDSTEVYFDLEYKGGYAWLFPKRDTANVGVGVRNGMGANPLEALDDFVERLEREGRIRSRTAVGFTSGLIPVSGPLEKTRVRNVLLVGDAAGQTNPITGGGIPQAVICGRIAGKAAAEAVKSEDMGRLEEYESEWRKLLGSSLNHAVRRRSHLDDHWDMDDLDRALRTCWIAFKEYYK